MTKTALNYRAEVIGSLLRPEYLKQAYELDDVGDATSELTAAQDRAALEAIALQEECGVDVVTDGEVRRQFWFDPLTVSLSGYDPDAPAPVPFTRGDEEPSGPPPRLPAVTARLDIRQNLPLQEFEFVHEHTHLPAKTTIPGMTYASVLWVPGLSETAYPDRDDYMEKALELMRETLRAVIGAGADYVQLDSPRYTHMVSPQGMENLRRVGLDTQTWLGRMIEMDNALMASFPRTTFGVHLCRGNHRSMWSVEGGYDAIAEQLFNELACDRLLVEYDSPRAGSFEPLRFVPEDKTVVLGLITTKEPELESTEELKRRIDEASQYVPLDRLALSPQCGFASTLPGNLVTPLEQRAKLKLLSSVAGEVWSSG